jgi:hypothetical protein
MITHDKIRAERTSDPIRHRIQLAVGVNLVSTVMIDTRRIPIHLTFEQLCDEVELIQRKKIWNLLYGDLQEKLMNLEQEILHLSFLDSTGRIAKIREQLGEIYVMLQSPKA